MSTIGTAAFCLLAGLALAGLAGSVLEIVFGRRLTLSAPFVDRRRLVSSLLFASACGPFMLVNDGLELVRTGRRGAGFLAVTGLVSLVWLFASGVLVADILGRIGGIGR